MVRATKEQLLLLNLEGKLHNRIRGYISKEEAYERLKWLTDKDFGYDVDKWRKWLENNPIPSKKWSQLLNYTPFLK